MPSHDKRDSRRRILLRTRPVCQAPDKEIPKQQRSQGQSREQQRDEILPRLHTSITRPFLDRDAPSLRLKLTPQRLLTARSIIAEKPSTLPRKDKPGSPKPFVSPLLYLLQTARSTVLSVPNFPSDALPCIPRRLRTRRHKQHYRLVKGDPHEGEGYGASD